MEKEHPLEGGGDMNHWIVLGLIIGGLLILGFFSDYMAKKRQREYLSNDNSLEQSSYQLLKGKVNQECKNN